MASPQENVKLPENPTLQEWQRAVDGWIKTVGVRYFDPLTNTAVLMEEVGEFARIMARVHGEQSFKNLEEKQQWQAQVSDELADVLFVLTCLANQHDINLAEALQKNLSKKTERDGTRHKNNTKL
ncbi:MAG: pyrophosphatase [Saprospirales bacterium]|nr:pyrophosphatase [Saprospirales bacterium]|tara:strand:- start:48 stop:422 length:375 start_codon:yes stop_codon:yes gene_type:complete